jgi:hypothetical protein
MPTSRKSAKQPSVASTDPSSAERAKTSGKAAARPTAKAATPATTRAAASRPKATAATPATNATKPTSKAAKPATKATKPTSKAAKPAAKPATKASKPTGEATTPAVKPAKATKPATKATKPATKPTAEATTPAAKPAEAAKPATKATKPRAQAATKATKPTAEATTPAAKPAAKAAKPATNAAKPRAKAARARAQVAAYTPWAERPAPRAAAKAPRTLPVVLGEELGDWFRPTFPPSSVDVVRTRTSVHPASLVRVGAVVWFPTREHYTYALACERPEADAYALEEFRFQQRWCTWDRAPEDARDGLAPLVRMLDSGLCHELETIWNQLPTDDVEDIDGPAEAPAQLTAEALGCTRTDRLGSTGGGGMRAFRSNSAAARDAIIAAVEQLAEEWGDELEDGWQDDEDAGWPNMARLRVHFDDRSERYGEERIAGLTGFGLLFEDGSFIARISDQKLTDTKLFEQVLSAWLDHLIPAKPTREAILEGLVNGDATTRRDAVARLLRESSPA